MFKNTDGEISVSIKIRILKPGNNGNFNFDSN